MKITIDKNEKIPLYLQIAHQLKRMIFDGSLVDGYTLPSERSLAEKLNVHRNTVVRAYSELKDEGLITSYQGKGYQVRYGKMFYGMVKKPMNWEALIKEQYLHFESDFDSLFKKSYETDIVSFGGGVAAREPYPPEEIASVFEGILKRHQNKAYFYTPDQGDLELRREIVSFMNTKGIMTKPGNIQVFSENNQSLDFIMTLMLSPGDKVLTQEILSPDIYRTIQVAGGRLITVPMDENGIMCDDLESLIERENPKFIYVDSSFHNPTGALLSVERRKKLLELSYQYRIPIIEEDEGSELYYDVEEVPSIKSMDTGNNVIYMYSFSLTMMPGAGISFVVADTNVIQPLSKLVSMKLVSLDWVPQMLLLEYMKQGIFSKRLDEFRSICRTKRDLMCHHIDGLSAETGLSYRKPKGGVYLWVKLPAGIHAKDLLAKAHREGVTFIPGYVFYPKKHLGNNYIRLNYSYPAEPQIEDGMEKLGRVIRSMQQKIQKK